MNVAEDRLHDRAKAIASDVAGVVMETDHLREQYALGGGKVDVAYDMYVEELRFDDGRKVIGVIDMGDLYQGVFEWDGKEWHDALYLGSPDELRERILTARGYGRI